MKKKSKVSWKGIEMNVDDTYSKYWTNSNHHFYPQISPKVIRPNPLCKQDFHFSLQKKDCCTKFPWQHRQYNLPQVYKKVHFNNKVTKISISSKDILLTMLTLKCWLKCPLAFSSQFTLNIVNGYVWFESIQEHAKMLSKSLLTRKKAKDYKMSSKIL
jgi:hypothetical protein